MNIHDGTVAILTQDARIAPSYAQLSAGDRSVLFMMLDTEDSIGSTVPDSPNDVLWSCLAEHGWMEPFENNKINTPIPIRKFRLTESGRRALPVLLSLLHQPAD